MKEKRFFVLSLTVLILAAACVNTDKIVITSPDLSKIADGEYRGESKVGPVRVTLDVTMENGKMTSLRIVKHFNGRGEKAEEIVPRIMEAQSLNVDVISGATASSKAILQAAERALTAK